MNNLGRLIEKNLKLEQQLKANAAEAIKRNKGVIAELENIDKEERRRANAICVAFQTSQVPEWTRYLAIEKRRRELVAGGDILWKPIDSTARKVVQKAPWWAFPIPLPGKFDTKSPWRQKLITSLPRARAGIDKLTKELRNQRKVCRPGEITMGTAQKSLNISIINQFIMATNTSIEESKALVEKATDARAAMEVMAASFKAEWVTFQEESGKRLNDFRLFRMAMEQENRQLMAEIREIRKFFLDESYETERNRLKEFIGLCHQLKALKESGFLDDVADTMLKLSIK